MKWAFLSLALLFGCERKLDPGYVRPSPSRNAPPTTSQGENRDAAPSEVDRAGARCLTRVRELPPLPKPEREARSRLRGELLARAKAAPVLFVSQPVPAHELSPLAARLRKRLEQSPSAWREFDSLVDKFAKEPALIREVLLTDGYLYTDRPDLGALYANFLTLGLLFREPVLELTRGRERFRLVRGERGYEHLDGPERGKPARLLLFDRVRAEGQKLGPDRHVDARDLAQALHADAVEITTAPGTLMGAELLHGALRVPALLEVREGRLELACEALSSAEREQVEAERAQARRRALAVEALREAMRAQVDEGLPFDEPKTEDGQQDGKLRPEWRQAYRRGQARYEFNGDRYSVFDRDGRPHVPQVCIDFITDTFERASGTWWKARGETRERVVGQLDFDSFELENKRSVEQFLEFAKLHPEWFDVHLVPPAERVPLSNRTRFFSAVHRDRAKYRPGDVVVIYGLRDDEKLHYHSFFVYENDPLTGMPTLVAANAGRPRIRTWENEMQNAPRRYVFARIRPRLAWLEAHLALPHSLAIAEDLPPPPG